MLTMLFLFTLIALVCAACTLGLGLIALFTGDEYTGIVLLVISALLWFAWWVLASWEPSYG